MSGWLQRQALAPAHVRLVGRARRRPHPPDAAQVHPAVTPAGPPVTEPAVARELAQVAAELASLRRDLRRVGLACLIAMLLLTLHDGWPALRWLLLVP